MIGATLKFISLRKAESHTATTLWRRQRRHRVLCIYLSSTGMWHPQTGDIHLLGHDMPYQRGPGIIRQLEEADSGEQLHLYLFNGVHQDPSQIHSKWNSVGFPSMTTICLRETVLLPKFRWLMRCGEFTCISHRLQFITYIQPITVTKYGWYR